MSCAASEDATAGPFEARLGPRSLAIYYGSGELPALSRYLRAALQPSNYSAEQLQELARSGTRTLAYLSVSEDSGPPAPWQRDQRNPDWGGSYVYVSHPAWRAHVLATAAACIEQGFTGFFIDTLDSSQLFPGDSAAVLELVRDLRLLAGDRYLLANRGFELLPELSGLVNGFVFESFSTTWSGNGYRVLSPAELYDNTQIAHVLQATGRDLFALDYADTTELMTFARARARAYGFGSVISNRTLTYVARDFYNQSVPAAG